MTRQRQFTALTVMLVLVAGAVGAQRPAVPEDATGVPRMSLEEFRKRHAAGEVLVVDVRDEVAFSTGRIPSAVNVPLADVERRAPEIFKAAKDRPIVTYCACPSEHTSAEAGLILIRKGGRQVAALVGGWVEWVVAGGQVER